MDKKESKADNSEEFIQQKEFSYFSMEIGIDAQIPTYSGGLGVLAGDMIKSCADLKVPLVAVTLLYKKGYFYQKLDINGNHQELLYNWQPEKFLTLKSQKVNVTIENKAVVMQAWEYRVISSSGYFVPIYFLDTDIPDNDEYACSLSYYLYGGDLKYRLAQEIILGIGGVRMLKEFGYTQIKRYHMNEGHSSLLTLELINEEKKKSNDDLYIDRVKRMCVFTTHTPIPAGMDQFPYDLVKQVLDEFMDMGLLKKLAGEDKLNMTRLALNLSHYENGVAKEHQEVSRELFPGYHINYITNGVNSSNWVSDSFKRLFNKYIPGWENDPFSLRYALSINSNEIWQAHQQAKDELIDYVKAKTSINMDQQVLNIGFARRATGYKRADLIFHDINFP